MGCRSHRRPAGAPHYADLPGAREQPPDGFSRGRGRKTGDTVSGSGGRSGIARRSDTPRRGADLVCRRGGATPAVTPNRDELKRAAALRAIEEIEDGMVVGLGTGSTAFFVVEGLARRVARRAPGGGYPDLRAHGGAGPRTRDSDRNSCRISKPRSNDRRRGRGRSSAPSL